MRKLLLEIKIFIIDRIIIPVLLRYMNYLTRKINKRRPKLEYRFIKFHMAGGDFESKKYKRLIKKSQAIDRLHTKTINIDKFCSKLADGIVTVLSPEPTTNNEPVDNAKGDLKLSEDT